MWDSLGEKFKKKSDVVIAKIDATKNEVDGVQISEFPSFIFFPRNSDEVKKIGYFINDCRFSVCVY